MKIITPILPLYITIIVLVLNSCSSLNNSGNSALYDKNWELEYLEGLNTSINVLFPTIKPYLLFNKTDNVVRGNAGCNGYSAEYDMDGNKISFADPGPSTLMYCGEGEEQFLNLMKEINNYTIDSHGKLNLMVDAITIMRFHNNN